MSECVSVREFDWLSCDAIVHVDSSSLHPYSQHY